MRNANRFLPQGSGLAAALLRRAATVELDWAARSGGRFEATDSAGVALAGAIESGLPLRSGDVLVADDGSLVRVLAAIEPVLVVRAAEGANLADVVRAAYHLGNRHVPVEPRSDHLKIAPDDALAGRLRRSGLVVVDAHFPFEPEVGSHAHEHGDDHAPGHAHDHAHDHTHGHAHGHAQDHDHDHPTGHDHDHEHRHPHEHGHGH